MNRLLHLTAWVRWSVALASALSLALHAVMMAPAAAHQAPADAHACLLHAHHMGTADAPDPSGTHKAVRPHACCILNDLPGLASPPTGHTPALLAPVSASALALVSRAQFAACPFAHPYPVGSRAPPAVG